MMATAFGLVAMNGWAADVFRLATGGLLAAVWQGVLLSLAIGLGLRLLPKTPAAVRFAVWFAVFLVVSGLPMVTLLPRAEASAAGGRAAWLTLDARWCVAIAALWAAASIARAVTLLLAGLRVRSLWKRARALQIPGARCLHLTPDGESVLNSAQGRRAQLCVSDEVDRPTVIGFFAPKILLPSWLVDKLTAFELEQIVLHEAGHLSRADDWLNLLQKIALVVFPLNPALAWVERRLCFERELACDERVLKATRAPKAYAACLANLAEHRLGRGGLALALGALGRESQLGRRVRRILERRQSMPPAHARRVLGGALLGLLAAVAGLERCPQVVGFAPASELSASAMVSGRAALRSQDRSAYQPAALRERVPQMDPLQSKLNRSHAVKSMIKTGLDGDRGTPPVPVEQVVAQSNSGSIGLPTLVHRSGSPVPAARGIEVADVNSSEAGGPSATRRMVQWTVVTSWQGEDGLHMVLTTATMTSGAMPTSAAGLHRSSSARATLARPAVFRDSQGFDGLVHAYADGPVHPYAAVPVQDGWLVFQL